ncbi:MAG TPA: 30S ribosomal protein S17 [Candidatus Nanoarchaeia archaeon]|nr:30S ribosomal protein S17 [Candidatus Nanoarchaeia archaeon]
MASKQVLGVNAPNQECTDIKCPFHGEISVKRELLKGKVIKKDINRSATIEWLRSNFVKKYERYEIKRSKMRTHNPACLNAAIGDKVVVARTRPLSKTKHHVIIQIVGKENESIKK